MDAGELIEKIVANQADEVCRALSDAPELTGVRDPYLGSTPRYFAAHRGFKTINVLLLAGADVRARETASGTTSLQWAAEGGHPPIVTRGADLEVRDEWFGLTPLGWATMATWAPAFHEDRPATATMLVKASARDDVSIAVKAGRLERPAVGVRAP
jgi:hypothetical protein